VKVIEITCGTAVTVAWFIYEIQFCKTVIIIIIIGRRDLGIATF